MIGSIKGMIMNAEYLKKQQELIVEYIYRFSDKSDPNTEPILDGIADESKYAESKYRIAWILKEPYDEDDGSGGGWSLSKDLLSKQNLYSEVVGRSPTWQPMVYVTYSILNGFVSYSEMDYIRDDPEMAQCLNKICLVNINKKPAFHRSNDLEIGIKYQYWKPILFWQMKVYDPQIVIFGNTFQHFWEDMSINSDNIMHGDCVDYIATEKVLYISAYHPAQTTITRDRYVNGIIDIIKNNINKISCKPKSSL